jgi:hypothetical protein
LYPHDANVVVRIVITSEESEGDKSEVKGSALLIRKLK